MECLFCNLKLKSQRGLQEHYGKHTRELPHLCPKCPKELCSKQSLNNHLETHKSWEEREMKCHLCEKVFVSKADFSLHIKYHDEICGKKFQNPTSLKGHKYRHKNWTGFDCKVCGKRISSKPHLRRHEQEVHGEKIQGCHECGKKFTTKFLLSSHLKRHAVKRERFHCDNCPKSFLTKFLYEEHIIIHQDQEYSFECDKCEKRFLTRRKLKVHKSFVHLEKARAFSCLFCAKQFPNYSMLEIHLNLHTLERPYFCRHCPAEFKERSTCRRHIRTTHSRVKERFECGLCAKTFQQKRSLDSHIRLHMGELHFKCQSAGCGMQFATYDRQRNHFIRIHVGKQFTCAICEKKFFTKSDLKQHAHAHTDFRAYHCNQCDWSFKQMYKLKRHKRTVHKDETTKS